MEPASAAPHRRALGEALAAGLGWFALYVAAGGGLLSFLVALPAGGIRGWWLRRRAVGRLTAGMIALDLVLYFAEPGA